MLLSVNVDSIGEYRMYYIVHSLLFTEITSMEVRGNEIDFA